MINIILGIYGWVFSREMSKGLNFASLEDILFVGCINCWWWMLLLMYDGLRFAGVGGDLITLSRLEGNSV